MSKRTHKKQSSQKSQPFSAEKLPESYFEETKNISCPKCGGHKLCNIAGGIFPGGVEINTYLCFDCKNEFDV